MFCYLSKNLSRCIFSEHEETENKINLKLVWEKKKNTEALRTKDSEINISL